MTRSTATSTSDPAAATVNTTARIHRTREDGHSLPCRALSDRPGRGAVSLIINTLQRISTPWTKTYASGQPGVRGWVLFSRDDTYLVCGAEFRSERTMSPLVGSKVLGGLPAGVTGGDNHKLQGGGSSPTHQPSNPRHAMHGKTVLENWKQHQKRGGGGKVPESA